MSSKYTRLTHQEFIKNVEAKFGSGFTYLTEYKGTKVPLVVDCSTHGEFQKLPSSLLKTGCPDCRITKRCLRRKMSLGEKAVATVLKKLKIKYTREHQIKPGSKYRYDFYFRYGGKDWLLEWDSTIHFKETKRFKRSTLAKRQASDREKTFLAVEEQHILIRLDYTRMKHIEKDLVEILESEDKFDISLSNYERYAWIFKGWKTRRT